MGLLDWRAGEARRLSRPTVLHNGTVGHRQSPVIGWKADDSC